MLQDRSRSEQASVRERIARIRISGGWFVCFSPAVRGGGGGGGLQTNRVPLFDFVRSRSASFGAPIPRVPFQAGYIGRD